MPPKASTSGPATGDQQADAPVHFFTTLIKTFLHIVEALVDVKLILLTRLFSLGKPPIDAVIALLGKFVHVIETLVDTLYELAELARSYVLIFGHESFFP